MVNVRAWQVAASSRQQGLSCCIFQGMLTVTAVVAHVAGAWQSMESARGPFWSWCPWSPSRTRAQLKGAHFVLREPAQDLPVKYDLTLQLGTQHLHAALPLGSRAQGIHTGVGSFSGCSSALRFMCLPCRRLHGSPLLSSPEHQLFEDWQKARAGLAKGHAPRLAPAGTGGSYFISGEDGMPVALFKPNDEVGWCNAALPCLLHWVTASALVFGDSSVFVARRDSSGNPVFCALLPHICGRQHDLLRHT